MPGTGPLNLTLETTYPQTIMETTHEINGPTSDTVTREKLAEDLRILARDAEALLKATVGELGDNVSEKALAARARLTEALAGAKTTCQSLQEKTTASAKVADQVIRSHPYESIGVAFGVGLLIGVLATRK